jgi:hypothetical protein
MKAWIGILRLSGKMMAVGSRRIAAVPGVIVYGATEGEAKEKACALAETVVS